MINCRFDIKRTCILDRLFSSEASLNTLKKWFKEYCESKNCKIYDKIDGTTKKLILKWVDNDKYVYDK